MAKHCFEAKAVASGYCGDLAGNPINVNTSLVTLA